MTSFHDEVVEAQSVRYLNVHNAPISTEESGLQSNILPLEVLQAPMEPPSRQCDHCRRWLTEASFLFPVLHKGALARHTTCKVCFILLARAEIKVRLAKEGKLGLKQHKEGYSPPLIAPLRDTAVQV